MKSYLRFLLIAVCVFTAAGIAYLTIAPNGGAIADKPIYWITVDESEIGHLIEKDLSLSGTSKFEVVESRGGLAIIKLDELDSQYLSGRMHEEYHKCAGFLRHETYEEAQRSIDASLTSSAATAEFVTYTINNQSSVVPMLAEAAEPNIRQTITDLSSLHTRRHDQQGGLDGANMILTKWRQIALASGRTDVSVVPYAHLSPTNPDTFLTPQPSIILTITGTEFPDEIIVVGGHQDSIRSGQTTGAAPGADDDASGIASITETIRVLLAKGFRPKRTLQFMAYAAEEVGLVGSKNIAQNYRAQNKNVIGSLQLDMTNYGGNWADIVIITDNTNAGQNQFLRDLVTEYQPTLVVKNDQCGYGCSDHKSWFDQNYPASMPFEAKFSGTSLDGIGAQYNTALHTANDTLTRSNGNANHALKFTKLAISYVGELAKGNIAQPAPNRTPFDFDADGRADVSVFRPADGVWHIDGSTGGYSASQFGIASDTIVPADYDGDGKTDLAVYRDGTWHMLRSQSGYSAIQWGVAGDIPQPQDFDDDGKADIAVFRPSNGVWYVLNSNGGNSIFQFGQQGDEPISSDFDGDGIADAAVFREGVWHIKGSANGYTAYQFGIASDTALVADFDGDGKADSAIFRDGVWYVLKSTGGVTVFQWGVAGDVPAAADYDGDGKADLAVYRGGTWYIYNSSNSSISYRSFGISGDRPAANAFVK